MVKANGESYEVAFGLDTYAETNFVSIDFVRKLGLQPCTRAKHDHAIPTVTGAGRSSVAIHGVYHLRVELTDGVLLLKPFARSLLSTGLPTIAQS